MWGTNGDEHAGFADFQAAEAVNDGYAMDAMSLMKLGADFAHLGEGHGFVSFVFEVERGAIMRLVADKAIESDDGAVLRSPDVLDEPRCVDRFANQLKNVMVERCGHGCVSSAADGRQKGHFVAGMERRIPRSEFLIARSHDGRSVFDKFRNPRDVSGKELLDGGSVAKIQRFLGVADDIFQAAEEQDLYTSTLGNKGHRRIVARAYRCGQRGGWWFLSLDGRLCLVRDDGNAAPFTNEERRFHEFQSSENI